MTIAVGYLKFVQGAALSAARRLEPGAMSELGDRIAAIERKLRRASQCLARTGAKVSADAAGWR